ncbi:MAG: phage head-tail connector protein [Ruminiclostridium sp.]|nr:phage head-tail connector protein [Ruminiclostridium sp.]
MRNIDIMRILLPPDDNSSDLRLEYLLASAENMLLDYIGRETLPERLNDAVVQTALALYNRLGNEGEEKRTEKDISVTFADIVTDDIKRRLKNYPRKVGTVNAADTENA